MHRGLGVRCARRIACEMYVGMSFFAEKRGAVDSDFRIWSFEQSLQFQWWSLRWKLADATPITPQQTGKRIQIDSTFWLFVSWHLWWFSWNSHFLQAQIQGQISFHFTQSNKGVHCCHAFPIRLIHSLGLTRFSSARPTASVSVCNWPNLYCLMHPSSLRLFATLCPPSSSP